jgi:hypothetical protein
MNRNTREIPCFSRGVVHGGEPVKRGGAKHKWCFVKKRKRNLWWGDLSIYP